MKEGRGVEVEGGGNKSRKARKKYLHNNITSVNSLTEHFLC